MTKKKPNGHNFGGTSKQKRRKEQKSKWVFSVTNSKVFGLAHSKYLDFTWIYVPLNNYLINGILAMVTFITTIHYFSKSFLVKLELYIANYVNVTT